MQEETQTPSQRFADTMSNLVGRLVTVKLADGAVYEGVLHTFELVDKPAGFTLYIVTAKGKLDDLVLPAEKQRTFPLEDVVSVECKYNTLEELQSSRTQVLNEVRADNEISTGSHGQERELQAWVESGAEPVAASARLDDWDDVNRKKQFAGWDQFSVNEQKFGVQTTYDEALYTTHLNRSTVSAEMEQEAKRIAAEIEGQAADNALVAEERGQDVAHDDKYDEEARYSTVLRDKDAGVYKAGGGENAVKEEAEVGGDVSQEGDTSNVTVVGAHAPAVGAAGGSDKDGSKVAARPGAPASEPPKSKLNPNAKAFVFNPKAKEFVPGGMGMPRPGGFGVSAFGAAPVVAFPGAAAGARNPAEYNVMPGAAPVSGAMPGPGAYPQMLRPAQGQFMVGANGQPFPAGSPPNTLQMGPAAVHGGMVRPPQFGMPPAPPGQVIYTSQQLSAMRGVQPGNFGFALQGAQQQPGMQAPAPGGVARYPGAPGGYAGPQPPRQGTFPPRLG